MEIYEHRPEEEEECLGFRNSIFTAVDAPQWKAMNCTAVTARDDGKLAGFVPLQFRDQLLRPGISIPVVYENAVGVADGRRGTGIGSRMMEAAADFIADRADALMVVRGGEDSDGYRFYRRTGHSDLCYAAEYLLPADAPSPSGRGHEIVEVTPDEWLSAEKQLLELYHRLYAGFGGSRPRSDGYWNMILESHVFKNQGWKLLLARSNGAVTGYITGIFGTWRNKEDFCVFEAVSEDNQAMNQMLEAAKRISISGAVRFPSVSLANPIRTYLGSAGFEAVESTSHLMARLLRPDRIFARLAAGTELLDDVEFTVATPHRALQINTPSSPRLSIHLAMKEHDLARLFLCRLDLSSALDTEAIRWINRDTELESQLRRVFEFSDWVQWFTDYV